MNKDKQPNNKDLNQKRGTRLRECREEMKLTQQTLSDITGYTSQHISYIENGKRGLSFEAAYDFAQALGVRQEYLLCKDNLKTQEILDDKTFKLLEKFENMIQALLLWCYGIDVKEDLILVDDNNNRIKEKEFTLLFDECEIIESYNEEYPEIIVKKILVPITIGGKTAEIPFQELRDLIKEIYDFALFKASKLANKNSLTIEKCLLEEYFK